jgi:hypothetical protein
MCGLPDVSLVDCLGTMPMATVLVFHACRCGAVSIVASTGVLLLTRAAALWICVLAWRGGAILGCVIFGNVPDVLHRVVHWCVCAFACWTRLEVGLLANMVGGALLTL